MGKKTHAKAPKKGDRSYHRVDTIDYEQIIQDNVQSGRLNEQDGALIKNWIDTRVATSTIAHTTIVRDVWHLIRLRDFIGPFAENDISAIHAGIRQLKGPRANKGKQYKINTLRDYIRLIKMFYLDLIKSGQTTLMQETDIRAIRTPRRDTMTVTADDILTVAEVRAVIEACSDAKQRALIAIAYETGCRPAEVATLTWRQIREHEEGFDITVNGKTKKTRFIPVVISAEYLRAWIQKYPYEKNPDGLVFFTRMGTPYRDDVIASMVKRIAQRAGIRKRMTMYLFRHTRVTHLILGGVKESVIRKVIWGNLSTNMLETYLHLADNDITDEFNALYGISNHDHRDELGTLYLKCPHCNHMNPHTFHNCARCDWPLEKEEADAFEEIKKRIEATPEYHMLQEQIKSFQFGEGVLA